MPLSVAVSIHRPGSMRFEDGIKFKTVSDHDIHSPLHVQCHRQSQLSTYGAKKQSSVLPEDRGGGMR